LCADACAAANACGFEAGAEGCVASCEADPASFGVDGALACASEAISRAEGCLGVATCLGLEVPVPTPACAELCDAQRRCDPELDLFSCHTSCIESDEGDIARATCASLVSCDEIEVCVSGDATTPEACMMSCASLAMSCEGSIEDSAVCEAECAGVALANGEEGATLMSECLSEAINGEPACSPEAIDACFAGELAPPSEEICARSWAAHNVCPPIDWLFGAPEEADFLSECDAEFRADPNTVIARVECFEEAGMNAASDPFACFATINCP
jgi:hypothetical protein